MAGVAQGSSHSLARIVNELRILNITRDTLFPQPDRGRQRGHRLGTTCPPDDRETGERELAVHGTTGNDRCPRIDSLAY